MEWSIKGTYFETCNCDSACPCAFMSAPSKGECKLLVGWHIDEGRHRNTRLERLNIAMAVYSPGHMMETKWTTALYIDERADDAQRDALQRIFSGQAGGHPQRMASHYGELLGVKSVPIEYAGNGKHQSLRIPRIAQAEIADIAGEGGAVVAISARPWAFAPGFSSVVARSEQFNFDDYDFHWNISGENGFHSPFVYQG